MFFNVNLNFSHVYKPLTFFYTPPPHFKFLDITLQWWCHWCLILTALLPATSYQTEQFK